MSQSFADNAYRLAGLAGRQLGWPPHWFWRATPAELAAVLAPPEPTGGAMSRADLERMMEHDGNG